MNEEAIKLAYDLFVADGYTKSIDEFKKLMRENPNGREVAYNLFVNDGYQKSINDFSPLSDDLGRHTHKNIEELFKFHTKYCPLLHLVFIFPPTLLREHKSKPCFQCPC